MAIDVSPVRAKPLENPSPVENRSGMSRILPDPIQEVSVTINPMLQQQQQPGYYAQPQQVALPPGWQMAYTPEGQVYYVDHTTRTTHWTLPQSAQQQMGGRGRGFGGRGGRGGVAQQQPAHHFEPHGP